MKEKHSNVWVVALIVLALGYAWMYRHALDDAFITFRYSKHLAEGLGPVWNADQRVEGYTNFLWMLVMSLPIGWGWDPVLSAVLLSLGCLGLHLWLMYRIVLAECGSPGKTIWMWLPVVSSHTLLMFATSGLETSMNTFLWTLALWQLQRILKPRAPILMHNILLLGLTVAVSILSRLEGGLLALACILALSIHARRADQPIGHGAILFMLPIVVLVGPWLVWKLSYYGDILPNSFHVKAGNGSLLLGLKYAFLFGLSGGAWLPLLFGLGLKTTHKQRPQRFRLTCIALAGSFLAYAVLVGGDYMEFRLLAL